ncbi:MAG: hypothetical protein ACKVN9_09735 [Methylophilaceae bacterium]
MSAATQSKRNMLLGTALAATVGLALWVQSQEKAVDDGGLELARPNKVSYALEKPTSASKAQVIDKAVTLDWTLLAGRELALNTQAVTDKNGTDLFKPYSWYVPPPKSAEPPPPPPKPEAPLVPFNYIGRMEGMPQGTLLMFSSNNKMYTVAASESLDKVWRLDGEDANTIRFTYLPLGLPQTLAKAGKAAVANPSQTKKLENQGSNQ